MHSDPALETLLLPIVEQRLPWPAHGGALFLRARDGWPLHRQPLPGLVCQQAFKPEVDALLRSGLRVVATGELAAGYALVLLLPPRQRDEARALYAQALSRLAPGGLVLACATNDAGAKSAQTDLSRIAGPLTVHSKNKCRVFWTAPSTSIDRSLLADWQRLDAPRRILGGRFLSRPGVFAWDRIDPASQLLAEHLPADLAGDAADLGAGYGYLATELLRRCAAIGTLDLFEADARALALARHNLAACAARCRLGFHWHDVTSGLPRRYDVVISNPPFHGLHGGAQPDIGRRFISAAAAALRPGGRLLIVANRHLPYEAMFAEGFASVATLAQRDGYKVIEARASGDATRR